VDAVKNWKKEIDTWATNSGTVNIPIVLFANKADLLKDPLDAFKTGAVMERGLVTTAMRCKVLHFYILQFTTALYSIPLAYVY
jgi:hypothetical protein